MSSIPLLNFLDTQNPSLFSKDTLHDLESNFDVTSFDRKDWSDSHVKKILSQSRPQIILTGWGCENLKLTDALIESTPDLKIWAHVGSSLKAIFAAPETIHRLQVLTTASIIGRYVAESTVRHLIDGLRGYRPLNMAFLNDGHWGHFDNRPTVEKSLYHATVGLIGLGKVGAEVVRLLKPFGTTILVYDPYLPKDLANQLEIEPVSLEQIFERSDAVSLHAAATDDTFHLVHADLLKRMRDGSGIVNTARGALIDTQALVEEIRSGRLWCAIDTYENEQNFAWKNDPLLVLGGMPNCFLTPHVAGITPSARSLMVRELLQESLRILSEGGNSPLKASASAFHMG